MPALAAEYRASVVERQLADFARALGVSAESLLRLGTGWDGQAWTFPMVDASGAVCGVRRRFPNGSKLSVKGGREGVFMPLDLPAEDPVLVCEGPTDTAAMIDLGFSAIGRPSCLGGVQLCCEVARGRGVVVVSDADEPGRRGAATLASVLRIYCPSVRVVSPPEGLKDSRAWVNAGATREDVQGAIGAAEVLRVGVTVIRHEQ